MDLTAAKTNPHGLALPLPTDHQQTMSRRLRERLHEVLEVAGAGDRLSRITDIFIICLIALNVLVLWVETVESAFQSAPRFFFFFDMISVVIFTLEYILRVWSCTASERFAHPVWGRLRFMMTATAIIDLLAFLPFYLSFLHLDLRFLRSFRLFRIFRLAKLVRYSRALETFGRVISRQKEEVLTAAWLMMLLLTIASSLIYFVENEAQPEAFNSIPAAMWWSVATLTTVGYGDMYPITAAGKVLGSIVAILGIGLFALPTALLAPGFIEELAERKSGDAVCPHCKRLLREEGPHEPRLNIPRAGEAANSTHRH